MMCCSLLQGVAGGCRVCRVLQCIATCQNGHHLWQQVMCTAKHTLQCHITVYCIVLQFVKLVALCGSEGCVAVCLGVKRGVAVVAVCLQYVKLIAVSGSERCCCLLPQNLYST